MNQQLVSKLLFFLKSIAKPDYDLIVAIGGGVVMDFAKLVSVYLRKWGLFENHFFEISNLNDKIPLVCIPTTSGSGSEATHFAVVYKNGQKFSVAASILLPDYAIIDPTLTYHLPKFIAASAGIDALCQSIESIWALSATDESRNYAKFALLNIVPSLVDSVESPSPANKEKMAIGAHFAGKAINISKTTVLEHLRSNNIERRTNENGELQRKYTLNLDAFQTIDSEISAYVLGFMYADGYNNEKDGCIQIGIVEEDKEIFRKSVV